MVEVVLKVEEEREMEEELGRWSWRKLMSKRRMRKRCSRKKCCSKMAKVVKQDLLYL